MTYINTGNGVAQVDRLFVYGIFLDKYSRERYGMVNPKYATVKDFITVGDQIVQAVAVPKDINASLTGLLVYLPQSEWESLDQLERGYERIVIRTTTGEEAYMYVLPERKRHAER